MNQPEATKHVALWADLTRRAPVEVRTPAASLLAFASWLDGNGASAWVALDLLPEGGQQDYPLAAMTALVLNQAIPPTLWDHRAATEPRHTGVTGGPSDGPTSPCVHRSNTRSKTVIWASVPTEKARPRPAAEPHRPPPPKDHAHDKRNPTAPPSSPTPAEQRLARIIRPDGQLTDLVLDWVLDRVVFFHSRLDRGR